MATTLEELQVLITAETKGLRTELSSVKGQLKSTHKDVTKATAGITSSLKKMGGVLAGVFAIRAMVRFGHAAIGLASNLAEIQNVVDVTFGSMSADINVWSKNALEKFGLSELSAKKYSSTLGAMMKSSGLAGDQMKDMSKRLTELTGDMASFYNLSSDEAFDKIRSGLSGETEPLKRLGINLSVANLQAYALSQGITKSYNSMNQAEQTLLRYNYLLAVTSDAQGDFARTGGSWANQVRLLSEQWKIFKATIGDGLIAALTPVVTWLNAIIKRLQVVAQYFQAFMRAILGSGQAQTKAVDSAASAQSALTGAIEETGEALKGTTAGFDVFNDITQKGGADAGGFEGISPFPSPEMEELDLGENVIVAKVEALVAELKGAFAGGREMLSGFREGAAEVFSDILDRGRMAFEGVKGAAAPVLAWLVANGLPLLSSFASGGASILQSLWGGAKQIFDDLWGGAVQPGLNLMSRMIVDVLNMVKGQWDQFGAGIVERLTTAIDGLKNLWTAFWENFLQPIVNTMLDTIAWLWDKHLKAFVDQLMTFIGKLTQGALDIFNHFILPIVTWLVEKFGPVIANVFQFAIEVGGTLIAFITDMASSILKVLGGIIDFVSGVFSGDWEKAWNGIKDVFGGVWDGIKAVAKGVMNSIIDLVNAMIRGLNKLKFEAPSWVPIIGGKSWGVNIPQIPKLAMGGLAYSETLAIVGDNKNARVDPEVISPLSTLKQIILEAMLQKDMSTGGQREMRVTLLLENGDTLADMLIDPMNNKAKNLGYAPVFKPAT